MTKSRSKPLTMDEWRNSPKSARNSPKLTPEQAQQITDEAIAHNHKWDVQEKINARRTAETQANYRGVHENNNKQAESSNIVERQDQEEN